MTAKQKTIVRTALMSLLILTLASFCFLGSTFARYTSEGTGTASLTVAKWAITETDPTGTATVSFAELSPSSTEYTDGLTPRTNSTAWVKIADLKNDGAVDADITVAIALAALTPYEEASEPEAWNEEDAKALFTVELAKDATGTEPYDGSAVTLAPTETLTIYARVTWTTDDAEGNGDALDTMVGEYIETVDFTVTYNAVQVSQKP